MRHHLPKDKPKPSHFHFPFWLKSHQAKARAAMFVMINATDNPKMVALLLFVQVVMPLLQSNAADNEGASLALNVAILFLLGLSLMTFWKAARFCRVLYQLRGRVRPWVAYIQSRVFC
jgi:hypothetical protein